MKSIFHGFTAVCLLFSRHFIISGQSKNAFYYMQSAGDYLKTAGLFIAVWTVISSVLYLIRRRRPQRYLRVVTALLLISLLPLIDLALYIAGIKPGMEGIARIIYPLFCLSYIPGIIIIAYLFPLERAAAKIIPVFTAVALLAIIYAFPKTVFEKRTDNPFVAQAGLPPVHIILFDETSYYLLCDPELKDDFTNIRRFAAQSYSFSNAFSPGPETLWSIPKMLCKAEYNDYREHNDQFFISGDSGRTLEKLPVENSLFKAAQDQGYNTILIGGYIPYCGLFKDQLTFGRQYRNSPLLADAAPWPFTKILNLNRLKANTFFKEFADYTTVIQNAPLNSMSFVHFLIPHWPYIFAENGPGDYYWSTLIHGEKYLKRERYIAQTKYCDKKFGEIISLMKSEGIFDQSLIILISDHAEKEDEERTRIPLFIKAPYQQESIKIGEEVRTFYLKDFLDYFYANNTVNIQALAAH